MSFVGVDVGGTFLKAAILSVSEGVGPVERMPIPGFVDTTGAAREIDGESLARAVREIVARVSADVRIEGILVTGQMAGIAFVDGAGWPIAPLISWQDTRGGNVEAVARALGPDVVASLGERLRVGLPLITLHQLGVPKDASVTSLIGFAAGSLCAAPRQVVHATDAAAWGIYEVSSGNWSDPAVALAGLDSSSLPVVSRAIVPVGATAHEGIPVFCAVGDQQASLLGAGLTTNTLSVNLATGCQVSLLSQSAESPAQLRPYLVDDLYLHTITHLPAGRLLTAAIRDCRGAVETRDWAWAAANPGSDARVNSAIEVIAHGVADAARRLGASELPLLLSGGLVQRFDPVRERIVELLQVPATMYGGDDAALAGLAAISARIA